MTENFDLPNFTLADMVKCGGMLRRMGENAGTMESVACNLVDYMQESFLDRESGKRACALIRLFKTHPYGSLPDELGKIVREKLKTQEVRADLRSLVLLGTAGNQPEWKNRRLSTGHQAIPLPSEEVLEKIPMLRNLVKQFGLDINTVISPDPALILDMAQKTYNVFYVPEALGSPYIPAQENFVKVFGIRSVFGFGGVLTSGDVYTVIAFSTVRLSGEVVNLFKTLALNVKIALMPYEDRVFN